MAQIRRFQALVPGLRHNRAKSPSGWPDQVSDTRSSGFFSLGCILFFTASSCGDSGGGSPGRTGVIEGRVSLAGATDNGLSNTAYVRCVWVSLGP